MHVISQKFSQLLTDTMGNILECNYFPRLQTTENLE